MDGLTTFEVIWKGAIAVAPFVWLIVRRLECAKGAKTQMIADCVEAGVLAVYHQIVRPRKTEGGAKITDTEASQFRAAARNIAAGLAKEHGIDLTAEKRAEFLDAMIERTITGLKGGKPK